MNINKLNRFQFAIIFCSLLGYSYSTTAQQAVTLPAPYATPSVSNNSKVSGWEEGKTPIAPKGFKVSRFADSLDNPRWLYVAPNGDIFAALANTVSDGFTKTSNGKKKPGGKSSNTILIFRDADRDGRPELQQVFLSGLNRPFGMLILGNYFYVANTDGLWRYPYQPGVTSISATGTKILDLPAGGYNNHWTRNIIASKDGSKIYVSVGSGSNVGEHGMENEVRRANILEINPDGTGEKIYAAGLRNPVGMDWATGTTTLWTAVNERDELGDELVPDYATSVQPGGFYGWPYAYFGSNADPRLKGEKPGLVAKTIIPDVNLGAHTASLGLAFNHNNYLGPEYAGGMFIGQHGSWNRSKLSGYKVVFVPFRDGKPAGTPQDFLTGFIEDAEKSRVYGRPVCVAFSKAGALLVTDDSGKTIWSITKE